MQVDAGYRVGALELTGGESGSRGSAGKRAQEAAAAADVMGLAVRVGPWSIIDLCRMAIELV